jgi:hypothetical protein
VLHLDSALERPALEQLPDRVVEGTHGLHAGRHRLDPLRVEPEPVDQGFVEAGIAAGVEIDAVGVEDFVRALAQQTGKRGQGGVLVGGRNPGQDQRRRTGAAADGRDGFGGRRDPDRVRNGVARERTSPATGTDRCRPKADSAGFPRTAP